MRPKPDARIGPRRARPKGPSAGPHPHRSAHRRPFLRARPAHTRELGPDGRQDRRFSGLHSNGHEWAMHAPAGLGGPRLTVIFRQGNRACLRSKLGGSGSRHTIEFVRVGSGSLWVRIRLRAVSAGTVESQVADTEEEQAGVIPKGRACISPSEIEVEGAESGGIPMPDFAFSFQDLAINLTINSG